MKQLLLLSFFLISAFSFSQSKSESLNYVFDSDVYKDERTISVFIPEAYFSGDTTKRWNVVYLFDADFQPYFTMVTSIMSYYEQTNEGIPLIIVGIHAVERRSEFIPLCEGEQLEGVEGADKLSLFLKNEVIPLVESNYRTTNFKIGIGHSLGGTFVMNEIFKDNSLFNAVIAVSPNLTVCDEEILKKAKDFYTSTPDSRRFIYSSAGTVGDMENDFRESVVQLDSITTSMSLQQMYWNCSILEGLNHMTTFVPTFDAAYLELSSKLSLLVDDLVKMASDTNASIVSQISDFHDELSLFSQEQHELSIDQILRYARTLDQFSEYRASIELYQFAKNRLEIEDLSSAKKKEFNETIDRRKMQAEFDALAQQAHKFAESGDYIGSSKLYIKAFEMNVIKGTHFVRIRAVPAFAQAGKIEEAFEQLDLLANKFALGGNGSFLDNPLCIPLHNDKRWEKFMTKLAENGKLYR